MFGTIVIIFLLGYAAWVFVSIACMGGIEDFQQYREDCAKIQEQLAAAKEAPPHNGYTTFNKSFG